LPHGRRRESCSADQADRYRKPLTQELINTNIAGRDYQIRAIRAVLEAIEQKKRDFLLVMATDTGKTRTCIAMVDALVKELDWRSRVRFMCR
jgi:type I site-specific restriction endonuclease